MIMILQILENSLFLASDEVKMVRTLDFTFRTRRDPELVEVINKCMDSGENCELVIGSCLLTFNSESQKVIADKVSDTVPFACKYSPMSIPYKAMRKIIVGTFDDDFDSIEYLDI